MRPRKRQQRLQQKQNVQQRQLKSKHRKKKRLRQRNVWRRAWNALREPSSATTALKEQTAPKEQIVPITEIPETETETDPVTTVITETVTETSLPAEMVRVRKGHPVMEQEETRTVRVITAVQEIIRAIIALQAVAALVRAITVLVQMADALRTAMDGRTIDSASRQQVKALQQKLRQRIRKSAETIAVLTSRSATRNREETRFTKKTAQQH